MFKLTWLGQMGKCAKCDTRESFIWRKGGISGSYWEGNLNQWIWRTSNLEVDHIVPLHLGGSNEPENLQLLCIKCHKEKTIAERCARVRRACAA